MTSNEIRASFLKYFEQNGHRIVPSSPLVPGDDPTLLFTNAGMNQFKDTFLGREKRAYSRAATSQKVMRVSGKHNDLENVGPSHRHHTFFQMLGNFSFGDYFKQDAIRFAWELLTDVWKIPSDRLVPSIFKGEQGIPRDDEAYELWKKYVPAERILEFGMEDNFWQMGDTGPCGRCSEIYYVRGGGTDPEIEIWNNVFMEFERSKNGTLTPLPAPSIDTGMGLERATSVLQGKESNYDTDMFRPLLDEIESLSGRRYGGTQNADDVSMRVVADHIRATTFLIGDGVIPSNEFRGYVLRKIMRRAMRHGKHLGVSEPFLHRLVAVLVREMGQAYPEIATNQQTIERTILAEEHRFDAVLTDGLPRLEAEIAAALQTPSRVLPGEAAFRLYDTFGVPYEFIEDTAETQKVKVDKAGYELAMEAQRTKARSKSAFGTVTDSEATFAWTMPAGVDEELLNAAPTHFVGYDSTIATGPLLLMWNETGLPRDQLSAGEIGYIALANTPFYVESGGQVDDQGTITGQATGATAVVEKMLRRDASVPRVHKVRVIQGTFHRRDIVTAEADTAKRNNTRRNHTATHLLHAALRQVLGSHVKQAGSLVAPDRLRFDFVHFEPVRWETLERIEQIVNERIVANTTVQTEVRTTDEAIASGAMALFGEKYGDKVRVVSVPGFSMELCGGTHVASTGDIGFFVITSESGVAAGVRRVEALTGAAAVEYVQGLRSTMAQAVATLHVNPSQAVETIKKLHADAKRMDRELSQLKMKLAMGGAAAAEADDTIEISGVKLVRRRAEDLDKDALRGLVDSLKAKIKSGIVVLASVSDGKVQIVAAVTHDLTSRIKAGQIVKELAPMVGGGGGGRPDFAEAGGKDPQKIDAMLAAAEGVVGKLLAG